VALADRTCGVCNAQTPPTSPEAARAYLAELPQWRIVDGVLVREVRLRDFAAALDRVNRIAGIAEAEGHHPDLAFGWGWLKISVQTHAIGALSDADFVLAAKIDRALGS
jgi:4a-hydroxytetrahydrobiopterin dehydratase